MTSANKLHRGLRYYRVFLVVLGFVLLGLNSRTLYEFGEVRRDTSRPIPVPEHFLREMSIMLLVPNVTMILMYLTLAIGRPRISNQTHHSAIRVLFALALVVGLIYLPAFRIDVSRTTEKELRNLGEKYDDPHLKGYTFAKSYFCSRSSTDDNDYLVGCQVNVARDMLYLISAVLVLVELGFGYHAGELGKQK
ncbi:hypothetical protein BGZ93_004398, partial [Podila epicladia]